MNLKSHVCLCIFIVLMTVISKANALDLQDEDVPTDYVVIFDASQSMMDRIRGGKYDGKTKLEVAKKVPFEVFFRDLKILDLDSIALIVVGKQELSIKQLPAVAGSEKKNELEKELMMITEESLGYPSNISEALRLAAEYFYFHTDPRNHHLLVIISDGKQSPTEDDICTTAKEIGARYGTELRIDSWIWFGIAMDEEDALRLTCVSAFLPHGFLVEVSEPTDYDLMNLLIRAHKEICALNRRIDASEQFQEDKEKEIQEFAERLAIYENELEEKKALYEKLKPIIYVLLFVLAAGIILMMSGIRFYMR